MIKFMTCDCNLCIECFKDGYKGKINSPEASVSLNEFSCCMCKLPKHDPSNESLFQAHLEHLSRMVNNCLRVFCS